MKNYYIDRYINLYDRGQLIQTQRAERFQTPSEQAGVQFLQSKTPQHIDNKNGLSMYECYIMVIKNEGGQYKRLINEITPQGIIKNV